MKRLLEPDRDRGRGAFSAFGAGMFKVGDFVRTPWPELCGTLTEILDDGEVIVDRPELNDCFRVEMAWLSTDGKRPGGSVLSRVEPFFDGRRRNMVALGAHRAEGYPGLCVSDNAGHVLTLAEINELYEKHLEFLSFVSEETVEGWNDDAWLRNNWKPEPRRRKKPKPPHVAKPGYVYLMACSSGYYKIGRSNNPEKRLKALTHSALGLKLVASKLVDDASVEEKSLHERFKDVRAGGEWFAITLEQANALVSEWTIEAPNGC